MAGETTLTMVGNLTADPELRFTNTGRNVASFTIASTPRTYNRETNQWQNNDDQTLFMRCSAWGDLAQNVADSLTKGMNVIARGNVSQRSYQAQDGTNRQTVEMTVQEIGPNLARAKATVTRMASTGAGSGNFGANTGAAPVVPAAGPKAATEAEVFADGSAAKVASGSSNDPWAESPAAKADADVPF